MHRYLILWAFLGGVFVAWGEEREMRWFGSASPVGQSPEGWRSTVGGEGLAGDWRYIDSEVPSIMPALDGAPAAMLRRPVLAQLAEDGTDEHFPMLIYEGETLDDFVMTVRFRLVSGEAEQMAGIAFRWQDEGNYYYVRASALGNTFSFFKVQDGLRSAPIGVRTNIEAGVWHTMRVECEGTRIRLALDGASLIPELTDPTFSAGKVALWTKSDTVAYFADAELRYTPRMSLAQRMVDETLGEFPRLEGLTILAGEKPGEDLKVVASHDPEIVGQASRPEERKVILENRPYYAKSARQVTLSMPLHDRNGDPVGVARVVLKRFPGQTEKNALARAQVLLRGLEERILESDDLWR